MFKEGRNHTVTQLCFIILFCCCCEWRIQLD